MAAFLDRSLISIEVRSSILTFTLLIGLYWILPSFILYYRVLLSLIGFNLVLGGLTELTSEFGFLSDAVF